MPKYRYQCQACTRDWWEWTSMDEPEPEKCPHCHLDTVKKMPLGFSRRVEARKKDKSSKENVIDHIEENKEILKEMKKQAASGEM